MRRMVYGFVMATLCSGAVLAEPSPATLEIISGPVFVDQGNGLVEADPFTFLDFDDRILMKTGSTALLTNNKLGCTISLRDVGLYRVPDMANCQAGQAKVMQSYITVAPASSPLAHTGQINAGGGAAAPNGFMFGLGFFGISAVTVATNTILEDEPVSDY